MRFLHEDRGFEDLLRAVAQQHPQRIGVALVEKDYWVTHTLWALQQQGFELWFKGGTSLSKGFDLVQRFSEDLDLKLEPGALSGLPRVSNWSSEGTRAVPHADDPGFLPTSAARWEPTLRAYRAIESLHWGKRRSLAETCSTIRGWLRSL